LRSEEDFEIAGDYEHKLETNAGVAVGDDTKLDSLIAASRSRNEGYTQKLNGKYDPTTPPTSSAKKRKLDSISAWADDTSSQISGFNGREIESFANTPLHRTTFPSDPNDPDNNGYEQEDNGWQTQTPESYAQEQEIWDGDLDPLEREGVPAVEQNGAVPRVLGEKEVRGLERREAKGRGKESSERERENKRAAKKARREAMRAEKGREGG